MNINFDKQNLTKPTLVIVEQKGSDEQECRERFMAGCDIFRELKTFSEDCRLMIVGGANNGVQPETIKGWCPEEYFAELIISNKAGNTYEKGVAVAEYVKEQGIVNIIQVTSLYHSLRAYLTTLHAIETAGLSVNFYNYVCDSTLPDSINFALLDEMLMSRGVEVDAKSSFVITEETYAAYLSAASNMKLDAGLKKFLHKRHGEARRIATYSEEGKNHLKTAISPEAVLATYLKVTA